MPFNNTSCIESINMRYKTELIQYQIFVPFVVYFARFTYPLWLAIGVPGSVLSLLVWSSKPMRSSSSIYLCALAILDLIFLLVQQLPFHIYLYYDVNIMDNAVLCQASPAFNMFLQYLSPLLTLGFTIERYISICHPFTRKTMGTVKRAIIVVSGMTATCFTLGLVQLKFYEYQTDHETCSEDIKIFEPKSFERKFYNVWSKLTEVLFFALVPLAILFFNILVLLQARKVIKSRATNAQQENASKSAATTATLLSVSFYQIGAVLPVTVLLFVGFAFLTDEPKLPCEISDEEAKRRLAEWPTVHAYFAYVAVSKTVDSLALSHYAMKFVIYMVTGRKFRCQLAHMCSASRRSLLSLRDSERRKTSEERRERRVERRRRQRQVSEGSAATELMPAARLQDLKYRP